MSGFSVTPSFAKGISDIYIVLDSYYRQIDESNPSNGELRWNIELGYSGPSAVGTSANLTNIIEMHIDSFAFPQIDDCVYSLTPPSDGRIGLIQNNTNSVGLATSLVPVDTSIGYGQYPISLLESGGETIMPWIDNPYTQIFNRQRITMSMSNIQQQSARGSVGKSHHFELDIRHIIGTRILHAIPVRNTYIFTDPLTSLDRISIIFRNPDTIIQLPQDIYNLVPISVIGSYISLRINNNGLKVGDRITISNYNSGIMELDRYINREMGHVVAGMPGSPGEPGTIIGDTLYTDPAIDISGLPIPPAVKLASVFIPKRRIRIPIRFRMLTKKITNGITI